MGVAISDVDTLVSYTLGNGQCRKAHIDQKGNVTVANIVDPDTLDACLFAAALHLPMQVVLADWENAAVLCCAVELLQIILNFLAKKLRHLDDPVAFGRFRCCDYILPFKALIGFVDRESTRFKVEVCRGQREKLSHANPAPIEHLKSIIGKGLVQHSLRETQVLIFRPE